MSSSKAASATSISKKLKRKLETSSAEKDNSKSKQAKKVQTEVKPVKKGKGKSKSATNQQHVKKKQGKFYTLTCDMSKRYSEIDTLESEYPLACAILKIETELCDQLMQLDYGEKVTHVYNPVDYAYKPHIEWYRKHCHHTAKVLLIGENPGPFGGTQSGVSTFFSLVTVFSGLSTRYSLNNYYGEWHVLLGYKF